LKIGIDFDRVLFNTDEFNKIYSSSIKGLHHVSSPKPTKHGVYCPEAHAQLCGIDPQRIWDFFKEQSLEDFLYSDVKLLNELKHELIIVTRGNERFQKMKLKKSGILEIVDDFVIVQDEDKDVAEIDALVDDRKKELDRVDVPGIRLSRPEEGLEKVLRRVEDFEA